MNDCLFCKIIEGEISATKVYEDKKTFAFLDVNPNNIGHTLVVPKIHSSNIFDIKKEDLKPLFDTVQKIAKAIKESLNSDGINIISNNERAAGQLVFHTHVHVIPRLESDGFKSWKGKVSYKEGEADAIAKKIKEKLIG